MTSQFNLEIAKTTLANADTLYNIGVKRFNLATISKEDLYTLKLALVNATNDFERAKTNLRRAQMRTAQFSRIFQHDFFPIPVVESNQITSSL